jgi:2-methylcitrate dehydratase PrpD
LEATLSLIQEHGIKSGDIEEVKLYLSPVDFLLLASPIEKKQNPANKIETQFSLCWGVASAIVYGKVEIRNFTDDALEDTEVRELARKVYPEMDISMAGPIHCPCKVEIKTRNNKVYAMVNDHAPLGSSENPLDFSFIADKFRQCCKYSVKPIPEKNQNTVIAMIADLEKVNDVGEIARLLA